MIGDGGRQMLIYGDSRSPANIGVRKVASSAPETGCVGRHGVDGDGLVASRSLQRRCLRSMPRRRQRIRSHVQVAPSPSRVPGQCSGDSTHSSQHFAPPLDTCMHSRFESNAARRMLELPNVLLLCACGYVASSVMKIRDDDGAFLEFQRCLRNSSARPCLHAQERMCACMCAA